MKKLKEIPKFQNEDEEFEFWSTHSFSDYLDPKKWKQVAPPMTPKTHDAVFLRMPHKMSLEVERLSKEKHVTVEEIARELLAAGLKQQRLQPGA